MCIKEKTEGRRVKKSENTKAESTTNIDILTTLNMMNYIVYSFFFPYPITMETKIFHYLSDKEEFSIMSITKELDIDDKYMYVHLNDFCSKGVIEKLGYYKQGNAMYKVIDYDKVKEGLRPFSDSLARHQKVYPDRVVRDVYKTLSVLYYSYTGDKEPQTLTSLLFFAHTIYSKFCNRIITKGRRQLTRAFILYYISVFGSLNPRKLHRLMPASTASNISATAKLMQKQGFVTISKEKDTYLDISLTENGISILKEYLENAKFAFDEIYGEAKHNKEFILAFRGANETGSEILKLNKDVLYTTAWHLDRVKEGGMLVMPKDDEEDE